jgi:hypothetical protein
MLFGGQKKHVCACLRESYDIYMMFVHVIYIYIFILINFIVIWCLYVSYYIYDYLCAC